MSWRALARRYPVLAIRDFRLLLVDRLLAPFSAGFSIVGVSFAVLKVTGSTADLSYVIAAQTAPMLVFSLLGGVFADRFRPQLVILAGNLAMVVGEGIFGLLMLLCATMPLAADEATAQNGRPDLAALVKRITQAQMESRNNATAYSVVREYKVFSADAAHPRSIRTAYPCRGHAKTSAWPCAGRESDIASVVVANEPQALLAHLRWRPDHKRR